MAAGAFLGFLTKLNKCALGEWRAAALDAAHDDGANGDL